MNITPLTHDIAVVLATLLYVACAAVCLRFIADRQRGVGAKTHKQLVHREVIDGRP